MGDRVASFEKQFAHVHGVQDAVAVNSCTAGLHLCLSALGVGPGDEVLVPSLTFVATVNAVLYCGAVPVFVDIDDVATPHISLEDAEAKCSPRTRAVIVMHYAGYIVDLPAWRSFADAHGLLLIEDAAHAPAVGEVGRLSDASSFSFFTNKNMTTSEGGMVLASDPEILERIRKQRSHGMTTGTMDRQRGHAYSYDVILLGYNYRMDELRAAMGLVQLSRLHQWNRRRRELTDVYRKNLAELQAVVIPFEQHHETSAHLMPIVLPQGTSQHMIMKELRSEGVQSSIHYPPVHSFTYYRERFPEVKLPKTEDFCARELTLPLHPSLHVSDVKCVIDSLRKAFSLL
jgi:dTDP-4-amino-4,6-dideoxygalactose transaminase